jgi:hypothetical protein
MAIVVLWYSQKTMPGWLEVSPATLLETFRKITVL